MKLAFTILGPPVPKARARKGKGGHWYTPESTRAYEKHVKTLFGNGAYILHYHGEPDPCGHQPRWPLGATYAVVCRVFFGDARRKDGDNVFKSIADAGNGVLWNDDAQIKRHTVEVFIDRTRPRVEVTVETMA